MGKKKQQKKDTEANYDSDSDDDEPKTKEKEKSKKSVQGSGAARDHPNYMGYFDMLKILLVIVILFIIISSTAFERAMTYIPGATDVDGVMTLTGTAIQGLSIAVITLLSILMIERDYI